MGDFQRALYDYSVAIKIAKEENEDPKILATYYGMAGVQHFELGQIDESLKYYNMAIEKDNQFGLYYYNRGLAQSKLDRTKEAIDDYSKALDLCIENEYLFQIRFNRGICFRKLGHKFLDKSIEDLRKAIELKGDKASSHNNLGLSYFEKGEFEESL